MIEMALRGTFVFLILCMAFRFSCDVRTGVLLIGEEEPFEIVRRADRPVAFWSIVVLIYMALAIIAATAAVNRLNS